MEMMISEEKTITFGRQGPSRERIITIMILAVAMMAQVKHFLKHAFGKPFDANYYAGDWMMGPNKRCWQEICYIGKAVQNGLGHYFKPYNVSDVELIETKLSNFQR